jgi:uncharacterized protein (TIGR02145 family)
MLHKVKTRIGVIILLGMIVMFSNSCSKKNDSNPTVQILVFTTTAVSDITQTTAISGGNITSADGANIVARGICWDTIQNPTIAGNKTEDGTGLGSFTSNLNGLTANTKYYVRAYVTVDAGTGYGNEILFSTKQDIPATVTDIDGNVYNTVTIGTQTWLKENLKTTKYNDGTGIAFPGSNNALWQNNTSGAYAWYNNDVANKNIYGALYNWAAVNGGKLCPAGWHVATDAEWQILTDFLGGGGLAGGKLKETGTTHWNAPNTSATNQSLFTALPGGSRGLDGSFDTKGFNGYFWSSTGFSATDAWSVYMYYGNGFVYRYSFNKSFGYSVRCVLD